MVSAGHWRKNVGGCEFTRGCGLQMGGLVVLTAGEDGLGAWRLRALAETLLV